MANLGLIDDLFYGIDSSSPYFAPQTWPTSVQHPNAAREDPTSNILAVSHLNHGMQQMTSLEEEMDILDNWHSSPRQQQEFLQQLQQHQQLSQPHFHSYTDTQPPHHLHLNIGNFHPQMNAYDLPYSGDGAFHNIPLQATQISLMPVSQATISAALPIAANFMPQEQSGIENMPQNWGDLRAALVKSSTVEIGPATSPIQQLISSPTGSYHETCSQPSPIDDQGWMAGDMNQIYNDLSDRQAFVNPNHIQRYRAPSESSYSETEFCPQLVGGLEYGAGQAERSPTTLSDSDYEGWHVGHSHNHSHDAEVSCNHTVPLTSVQPVPIPNNNDAAAAAASPIRSPSSQGSAGSPSRRPSKKSPIAAKSPDRVTKRSPPGARLDEKRIGRRRGPLKPDQKKHAGEIRKLGACMRCKVLKKPCGTEVPCAGCQPTHTRLWNVPCIRDIKDIGFFLKNQKFDFERHVTPGMSPVNIKGYGEQFDKPLLISHGYGHVLPVNAREVYIRDEKLLNVDWAEGKGSNKALLDGYEVTTAKLCVGMEGISSSLLSDYLDQHIKSGDTFEKFVVGYFEGTRFLSEILLTAHKFYLRTKSPIIHKALKLMLAYCLTLHITMVEFLPPDQELAGKIEDETSKFCGKTMAPVLINFEIKYAMAEMWRGLHKEVLEELSKLFSKAYPGNRLRNWPTIFILASVLLAVWELLQFDCHYRVPNSAAVEKFCNDMESTPVAVIVGLFQAVSQKLPPLMEWDTSKHGFLLGFNSDICKTMTELREHVTKYEGYLRDRPQAKFDDKHFDSLTNKFLSKLVIRAN